MTPNRCGPKYITVFRLVPLQTIFATPVLVSMQAADLVEVIPNRSVAKNDDRITAKDIMNV